MYGRHLFRRRFAGMALSFLLMWQGISPSLPPLSAQESAAERTENFFKDFPSELGTVEDLQLSGESNGPFIIHVQDIHSDPEVQKTIRGILKWVQTHFGKGELVIGLEGAAGAIHPEYLDLFPGEPQKNAEIVQDLLKKGELAGTELLAWEEYRAARHDMKFLGLEDPGLYRESFEAYRKVLFAEAEITAALGKLEKKLELAKSRIFSPVLNEFFREKSRRKQGDYGAGDSLQAVQLLPYISYLGRKSSETLQIDLTDKIEQIRFPQLVRILALQDIEKKFDPIKAEEQRKTLELLLSPAAPVLLSKGKNLNRRALEELSIFASGHKIDLNQYPDYFKKAGSEILKSEINPAALSEEMERIEGGLLEKWAAAPEQKQLVRRIRDFELLQKLLTLKLTRDEFERLPLEMPVENDLRPSFDFALQFYQNARKRDAVLLNGLLLEARGARAAVLVTGGFHTSGLSQVMKEKGIGYAVVRPKVKTLNDKNLLTKVFRDENAALPAELQKFSLTKQEALFLKEILAAGPLQRAADAVNHHPLLSGKITVSSASGNPSGHAMVYALITAKNYGAMWTPAPKIPSGAENNSGIKGYGGLRFSPARAEVRSSDEDQKYHEQRAHALVEYAKQTKGQLPLPVHPIDHFFRFKDIKLNLSLLSPERKVHYWAQALDYFFDLKQRGGHIISAVMAGGSASRMSKGRLPDLLIQALKEDPAQFVDVSRLSAQEWERIHKDFGGRYEPFIKALDPDKAEEHEILDRVLPAAKALLPAGKIDGRWYNLLGYHLINVKLANDEMEGLGLGRPFIAEAMLNDAYYPGIIRHLAEHQFYGLRTAVIQDAQGQVTDIDHEAEGNELLLYNQRLGYRKVTPVTVVDKIWEEESKPLVEQASREKDAKRREEILAKASFKTEAQYRYARQFSEKNEGRVLQ